ncbi:MAG: hypothetical protein ACFB0E_15275 [Leptolyngbyaceae cyanobacterium]
MVDNKVPLLDSQSSQSEQPEQLADASAERLMQELFIGVERALEGDLEALDDETTGDVAKPDSAASLNLNMTDGELPAVVNNPTAALVKEADGLLIASPQSALADNDETATAPALPRWRRLWTTNRALLGAAGLMMLASFGLWLQQRQQVSVTTTPVSTSSEVSTTAGHSEFLEYLRRSLDVIAQSSANAPATAGNVGDVPLSLGPNGSVGLPPLANNPLPPPGPGGRPTVPGSVNVIERVYVPYPSSQTAGPAGTAGVSTTPSPSTTASTGSNTAVASNSHALLGVLELGDRSAALFEIAGVPQRVYIGERIGNSGWSLVSVANEEAVVRRNGEVRTLYIGQEF